MSGVKSLTVVAVETAVLVKLSNKDIVRRTSPIGIRRRLAEPAVEHRGVSADRTVLAGPSDEVIVWSTSQSSFRRSTQSRRRHELVTCVARRKQASDWMRRQSCTFANLALHYTPRVRDSSVTIVMQVLKMSLFGRVVLTRPFAARACRSAANVPQFVFDRSAWLAFI